MPQHTHGKFAIDGQRPTGWLYTDATLYVPCPKCGEAAEFQCRLPSGRPTWPPHCERIEALRTDKPEIAALAERRP